MNINYERLRIREILSKPQGLEHVERLFLNADEVSGFAFDPMTGYSEISIKGDPHDSARLNLFAKMRGSLTSEEYESAERAIVTGRAVSMPGFEHPLVLLILRDRTSFDVFESQIFRLEIAIPLGLDFWKLGRYDHALGPVVSTRA